MDIKIKPESLRAKWYVNGSFYGAGPSISYVCPGTASTPTISAALTTGNLTLSCPLHVIEPDSVEGFSASPQLPGGGMPYKDGAENIAGVWMYLFFQVKSEDVSFENIEISEGRCSSTDATGYFADSTVWPTNFLVHLPGDSFAIKQKNNVFGIDYAGNQYIPSYPDNTWTDGSYSWDIPAHWLCVSDDPDNMPKEIDWSIQSFAITEAGTASVTKFGFTAIKHLEDAVPTIPDP